MTSEDRICLSNVKNKLGVVTPCCQPVKGVCYPLCHRHFKRRFVPDNLEDNQINSPLFCRQIIKTGKNSNKFCTRNSYRNSICWYHLQKYLGKCYYPDCSETSFYQTGMCSQHTIESFKSPCPCKKHSQDFLKHHYCQYHGDSTCDCLLTWKNSNLKKSIYLPNEILVLIFDYGDCYFYAGIRCLNKYFRDFQFTKQIVSKYCLTEHLNKLDSSFKIVYECSDYYHQLFHLLINTYNLSKSDIIKLKVYPEENELKFYVRHPQNGDTTLVHIFRTHFCVLTTADKTNFINTLRNLYNIYLSNLSTIINNKLYKLLRLLENISHHFNFFIQGNFYSKREYLLYLDLQNYLLRLLQRINV